MKITFLHTTNAAYNPGTPLSRPLGGTESAVAYLSAALAKTGAQVTLLNNSPVERYVDGVHIASTDSISASAPADCDLFVVISAAIGARVRPFLKSNVPMILWSHHDIDQPAVSGFSQPQERDVWDGFVMVSNWQAQRFIKHFSFPAHKVHVVGNAVSPAFLEQPIVPAWYETDAPPSLVYTSTPFRGLDVLLQSFPSIRALIPDVKLKIHSSMNIYGIGAEGDPYIYLYNLAKSLAGVDYVGPVSQSALARSLQGVGALAYPSTFQETSCIAVMESMASGADIVTTDLGALPETLNGFGQTLAWASNPNRNASNPALANGFIDLVVRTLNEARNNPSAAAERRRARIEFTRRTYNWDARALQWLGFARTISAGR